MQSTDDVPVFRKKILNWYDIHRRVLPWRALSGKIASPYYVWLSEIMLQQTTVQAVIPYFLKFIQKWPDVHALARADIDEVMTAWAGLGYYARARNLHKCAQIISYEYNGVFPNVQIDLKTLPGVGDYTSAAITSIAFDEPAVVVDGNIERVFARYFACNIPLPSGKKYLKRYAALYSEGCVDRPGDYAQALMDLGATICRPKSPLCSDCPVNEICIANEEGVSEAYPVRKLKEAKPKRFGFVYWLVNEHGEVLVEKRSKKGLLGGMYGLPTSEWDADISCVRHLDFLYAQDSCDPFFHIFTHFHLTLYPVFAKSDMVSFDGTRYVWKNIDEFDGLAFPSVFKKAISLFSL